MSHRSTFLICSTDIDMCWQVISLCIPLNPMIYWFWLVVWNHGILWFPIQLGMSWFAVLAHILYCTMVVPCWWPKKNWWVFGDCLPPRLPVRRIFMEVDEFKAQFSAMGIMKSAVVKQFRWRYNINLNSVCKFFSPLLPPKTCHIFLDFIVMPIPAGRPWPARACCNSCGTRWNRRICGRQMCFTF
jgi:hypothetical protein